MAHHTKHVVLLDQASDGRDRLLPLIELFECTPHPVASVPELLAAIAELDGVALVLIRDDPDLQLLHSAAAGLQQAQRSIPCYLVARDGDYPALPAELENTVLGILGPAIGYRDFLGALHEAQLFGSYNPRVREEYSAHLFRTLVGTSRSMQFVRKLTRQVASTEASVLITGESGTGKEVVARNVHYYSRRREHPFVPVNCGAIPADLLESELFGHEKGAFTGAYSSRQGRFELAEGGTLFLDEIGDMPLNMQVKLLRVLQERSFERVGSSTSLQANVRIVAATHQNLEQLVTEGKFRMDLYYRLNVFPIEVPPLRDRVEDIPLLLNGFIGRMERDKRGSFSVNECALAALAKYYWPGNVRELSNLVERLAILHPQKRVKWSDLPEKFRPNRDWVAEQQEGEPAGSAPRQGALFHSEPAAVAPLYGALPTDGLDLKVHLAEIECQLMTQALRESDWVVARAAKLLNLQRTTLVEKMRKYAIARPDEVTEF